ncbi:hypothetical protein MTR_5g070500 [Medicago truncatula]|uniref:Uncharacterized protein n=1 Tax=Medicago truncatula TaxID=3880 RepID=G7KE65_MEDTR|nr:hypothetical protein MTR_5g070500 [Medicago truncatula]
MSPKWQGGKLEKTIINSLKHQMFWNIVEVLKHQKKKNGGSNILFKKKIKYNII